MSASSTLASHRLKSRPRGITEKRLSLVDEPKDATLPSRASLSKRRKQAAFGRRATVRVRSDDEVRERTMAARRRYDRAQQPQSASVALTTVRRRLTFIDGCPGNI